MKQYNLTNSNLLGDLTSTKNVSSGNADFDIPISLDESFSIQVVYNDTDAADDTWVLKMTEDGTNYVVYPSAMTITSTITATSVSNGWLSATLPTANIRVSFTKVSSTTGTYKIILTTKEN